MLRYFVIFIILAICIFVLMYTLGGEWVEYIGCCEETMQKKLQPDAPETERIKF